MPAQQGSPTSLQRDYRFRCDLCGAVMREHACKVTCPNCGYRFDCSDLTLNFDRVVEEEQRGLNHGG